MAEPKIIKEIDEIFKEYFYINSLHNNNRY